MKVIRKLAKHLEELRGQALATKLPSLAASDAPALTPVTRGLSEELDEGAQDFDETQKQQQRDAVDALNPEK